MVGFEGTINYCVYILVASYMADWFKYHHTLYCFYSSPQMKNLRWHKRWANQQLYDRLANHIFAMMGIKANYRVTNRGEIIFVVEEDMIDMHHKGRRISKNAAFWKYFMRKVTVNIIIK